MSVEIGWYAACPSCNFDMGIVTDPTSEYELYINNNSMTAQVSDLPCRGCGTTVYRVHRTLKAVIRR